MRRYADGETKAGLATIHHRDRGRFDLAEAPARRHLGGEQPDRSALAKVGHQHVQVHAGPTEPTIERLAPACSFDANCAMCRKAALALGCGRPIGGNNPVRRIFQRFQQLGIQLRRRINGFGLPRREPN